MKKHRGGILIVTFIFFTFVTLAMFATLTLSIEEQRSAAIATNQTIVAYNLTAMADLAVGAAIYDVSTCSATIGTTFVGDVVAEYDDGLKGIQAKLFPSGMYWIDDINALVAYEGLPADMETEFQIASDGMTLNVELDSAMAIQSSASNVLEGEDGDFASLKPITLIVVVEQGVLTVQRTYEITGLVAHFNHMSSGVYITIQGNGAVKTLVAQTIA